MTQKTHETTTNSSETAETTEKIFAVQRLYVKNSLFEAAPLTAETFNPKTNPVIDLQAHVNIEARENDTHEAVLTLQLTAKSEGNLVWRIQLQQAGLYTLSGFEEEARNKILNGYCMNQLYPYAAANASTMAVQGGFPPVYLAPMNFEALYLKQKKQEALAGDAMTPATVH
jgi:preprotein translocase subunit SecB